MKVSEITSADVVDYLKLEPEDYSDTQINALISTAKSYISSYTGIPITTSLASEKTLDNYDDFYIVVMVLCQDMLDNRSMYVEKSNVNKVVDTILGMHCRNLL